MYMKNKLKTVCAVIKNKKKSKIIIYNAMVSIVCVVLAMYVDTIYHASFILSYILLLLVSNFLLFKKTKDFFDPFYLFSLCYALVPIGSFYSIITRFSTAVYINNDMNFDKFIELYSLGLQMFIIGYIATICGYYILMNQCKDNTNLKIKNCNTKYISNTALRTVVVLFACIGIGNFLYNVYLFSSGDIILYLQTISLRSSEFKLGGTTLGYHAIEMAVLMYLYYLFRNKYSVGFSFYALLIASLIILFSKGRLFYMATYMGTVIGVYYYFVYDLKKYNRIFFCIGISAILLFIGSYFFRYVSSYIIGYGLTDISEILKILGTSLSQFGYYAVDKGNIPNITLLPTIIENYSFDNYLYGSSYLIPVFGDIPGIISLLDIDNSIPAILVKNTYFSHISSGSLPVTVIGEAFMNFGYVGIPLIMFVVGLLAATLRKFLLNHTNIFVLIIYLKIGIGFFAILPKGEFNNFTIWMIIPTMVTYIVLRVITLVSNHIRRKKSNSTRHVVHFITNNLFTADIIKFFPNCVNEIKHTFIIYGGYGKEIKKYENTENIVVSTSLFDFLTIYKHIQNADKILVHGYNLRLDIAYQFLKRSFLEKTCIIFWGGDIYSQSMLSRKGKLLKFLGAPMKKRIIKECEKHAYLTPFDYDVVKKLYKTNKTYNHVIYSMNFFDKNYLEAINFYYPNAYSGGVIAVGHSANQQLMHNQVFKRIAKLEDLNQVIAPLSYGDKCYANDVIKKGLNLFGNKFEYFEKNKSAVEYLEFLSTIDVMVIYSDRQIALGNIYICMLLGVPVCVKENSIIHQYLAETLDLEIITLEQIETMGIFSSWDGINKEKNRNIMQNLVSVREFSEKWEKVMLNEE